MNIRIEKAALARAFLAATAMLVAVSNSSSAQAQAANQVFAQTSEQLAIDDKCKILDPEQRLAMELFQSELASMLPGSDLAAVDTWLGQVRTALADRPCTDPGITAASAATREAARARQANWAARVISIAELRASATWATMSPIAGVKRSAADHFLKELEATNPGSEQQFLGMARREAERALSILCPSMSTNTSSCPTVTPAASAGEATFAQLWLERIEQYANQMPGARLDGQPVLPAGVTDWSTLYTLVDLEMALVPGLPKVICQSGITLVAVNGSNATLYNSRDGFEIGKGEVSPMGAALTIRSPQLDSSGKPFGLIGCQAP